MLVHWFILILDLGLLPTWPKWPKSFGLLKYHFWIYLTATVESEGRLLKMNRLSFTNCQCGEHHDLLHHPHSWYLGPTLPGSFQRSSLCTAGQDSCRGLMNLHTAVGTVKQCFSKAESTCKGSLVHPKLRFGCGQRNQSSASCINPWCISQVLYSSIASAVNRCNPLFARV